MSSQPFIVLPRFTSSVKAVRVPVEDLASGPERLEQELAKADRVELVRGDAVIADVFARKQSSPECVDPKMPDFMARMKQMGGDRTFGDSTRWIREDRDAGY